MPLNNPRIPDEIKKMDTDELLEVMGNNRQYDATMAVHARHVYEQRKRDEQRKYDAEQLELKHRLENENISRQISANSIFATKQAKILEQQIKIMWRSTLITAASTVIAALAGAYLAYALTQTQKPLHIKLDSEQLAQLRTATTASVPDVKTKREKSPSIAPFTEKRLPGETIPDYLKRTGQK